MSTQTFSSPISKLTKPVLIDITQALSLSSNGIIKDLRFRIKQQLDEQQDNLSKDPRFQGLYQYRPSKNAESTWKNNADKVAEDLPAQATPQAITL